MLRIRSRTNWRYLVSKYNRRIARRRAKRLKALQAQRPSRPQVLRPRLGSVAKASLLTSTALASSLILVPVIVPLTTTPAEAVTPCTQNPPFTDDPISDTINDAITCTNTVARTANFADNDAIYLYATGDDSYIYLNNSGLLTSDYDNGVETKTSDNQSRIQIINSNTVDAVDDGINARTYGESSFITITNTGRIDAGSDGIRAETDNLESPVIITNTGPIDAGDDGIVAQTDGDGSFVEVTNDNGIISELVGIDISTGSNASGAGSNVVVSNDVNGSIDADVIGIDVFTYASSSDVEVTNSGYIGKRGEASDKGIDVETFGFNSFVEVTNAATGTIYAYFEEAITIYTQGDFAAVTVTNEYDGEIESRYHKGITVTSAGADSGVEVENYGMVDAYLEGIETYTNGDRSPITVTNAATGTITSDQDDGIHVASYGSTSPITVTNAGTITGAEDGIDAYAGESTVNIANYGSVYGGAIGIYSYSDLGTTILNTGDISAGSLFAIDVEGESAYILNAGVITGYVDLTDDEDEFVNAAGGTFEARLTSDFGGGDDVVDNYGVIHTANDAAAAEYTAFVGLENLNNSGLISLQDGGDTDTFYTDGNFNASGDSRLAVDAFLGAPGSPADLFIIGGNVTGTTGVLVNNTNPGGGAFNPDGIPIVEVVGATDADDFFLVGGPVDAGLFQYDLFLDGQEHELRSFVGPGAFALPQLATATQDIWHSTSDTWLARTADLRTQVRSGVVFVPSGKGFAEAPAPQNLSGVWAKGSGEWLDRDDKAATSAYGNTYRFDLGRELRLGQFQAGADVATRGALEPGDVVFLGLLGGGIWSTLDYDKINRKYQMDGGTVGGYITYLSGGFFMDTLVKADFLDIDPETARSGLPKSLDANTIGVRLDTGYRSNWTGFFAEPLGTIAVAWTDIDNFTDPNNSVTFSDETSTRGRLGLRLGTNFRSGQGTVEPFVTGSVWREFNDSNDVSLVSNGTRFAFADSVDKTWGEFSGGLNWFSDDKSTSAFIKGDVTTGDDIEGYGGQVGFRFGW